MTELFKSLFEFVAVVGLGIALVLFVFFGVIGCIYLAVKGLKR